MDKLAGASVKYFEAVVISKQDEREAFSTKPGYFKHFEVKRVRTTSLVVPPYLVRNSLFSPVYHVEKLIVVNTN